MKIGFYSSTSAWITGMALHIANPESRYYNVGIVGQVLEADRIVADLHRLNETIRKIPIVGGSGEMFLLDGEKFAMLKDFLKKHGRVVEETDTRIVVEEVAEG